MECLTLQLVKVGQGKALRFDLEKNDWVYVHVDQSALQYTFESLGLAKPSFSTDRAVFEFFRENFDTIISKVRSIRLANGVKTSFQ